MSPPRPISERPSALTIPPHQESGAVAPARDQDISSPDVDPTGLQKLAKKKEPNPADKAKVISALAGKLEETALSGKADAFRSIMKHLRGQDPKEIAQALHQIPSDAVAAQVLVVLGNVDRSNFASILFFLDFYSDPSKPSLLRDRASSLIASIHVPNGSAQDEAEVKFSVLSLLARNCWDNNYQNIHSLAGVHEAEGVQIISVTESADQKNSWFSIVAERCEQRTSEQEEHPGRQTEKYGTFVNTSELFSNNIRRVEFRDGRGNLIVRNYDVEDGKMGSSFEFRVFNSRGLLIEEGQEGEKSWLTKHFYDSEGGLQRDEGYQNGKLFVVLEFDKTGQTIGGGMLVGSRWVRSDQF